MFKTKSGALINPAHVTHIDSDITDNRVNWYAYFVGGARVRVSPADAEAIELAVNEWLYTMAPKSSVL